MCFFLFALLSDEPEVFLTKFSQTAILNAAQFLRVVNSINAAYSVETDPTSQQDPKTIVSLPGAQGGTIHTYHFRWEFLPKLVL